MHPTDGICRADSNASLITSMAALEQIEQTEQAARVEESVSFAIGEKFASYDELKLMANRYFLPRQHAIFKTTDCAMYIHIVY